MPTQGGEILIPVYWTTLTNMCQMVDKHHSKRKITPIYILPQRKAQTKFPLVFDFSTMQEGAKVFTKGSFAFRLTNMCVKHLKSRSSITRLESIQNFSLPNLVVKDYKSMTFSWGSIHPKPQASFDLFYSNGTKEETGRSRSMEEGIGKFT